MTIADEMEHIDAALKQLRQKQVRPTRCRVCIMAQKHHLVNPIIHRGRDQDYSFSLIAKLLNSKFGADTNTLNEDGMQVRDHFVAAHDSR